jgi:hypothetical protein
VFKKIFFYFFFIIYSLELLTSIFLVKEIDFTGKNYRQIKNEIFRNNPNFDQRNDYQAFKDEKEKYNIRPSFKLSYFTNNYNKEIQNFIKKKIDNEDKIPFRGPINRLSLGNNEDGARELIVNDNFGFKNFQNVYKKKINLMLVGDSFTEGVPYGNNEAISEFINKKSDINSINYGISGAGPLMALGVIREYGQNFQPNKIYYLYYEGNDLLDLENEKKTFLINYLNKNFSQNLYNSHEKILEFLSGYDEIFYKTLPSLIEEEENKDNTIYKNTSSKIFIEKIKDFIELQNLKEILPKDLLFVKKSKVDYDLFEKTIKQMNSETKKWDGNFAIIYLPTWSRYNKNFSLTDFLLKKKIIDIAKKNDIEIIDLDNLFKLKKMDNNKLFTLKIYSHYNSDTYNEISNQIISNFKK